MSNRYAIKEMFRTLQGEGSRTGCVSVFVRFSGCNLWSGLPRVRDADESPCAQWCDTAFTSGEPIETEEILERLEECWSRREKGDRWVVLTGGEPMLQVDNSLISALHNEGWKIAVETNGTIDDPVLDRVNHVCVSPKRGVILNRKRADELKVVLPGAWEFAKGWTEEELEALATSGRWSALYVQPMDYLLRQDLVAATALVPRDKGSQEEHEAAAMRYANAMEHCLKFINQHPQWRLSLQTNKLVGLP
jgi:organic radical activating enzyme